jgi:ribonuclease E
MVLMPGSTTKGISRKVENEAQRKEIKAAMNSIEIPDNTGYIVRTAGIGQSIDELHRDFKYLYGIHTKILDLAKSSRAPKLIYQESNLVIRTIRDYFSPEMDEVLIDDPIVFKEAQDFFRSVMPEYLNLLKRHQEHRPIFSRYQIEEQIETITQNKVPLPSGGSIVIDLTAALVAIDVNSGKMSSEKGIEATAFKANVEAATEVGRQLRLRDIGGLIVVDFIDMRDRKHNREVEKALKESLKNDKARVSVGRISQFGLLEMSRQRIRAALSEGAFLPCPHCVGSGRVKSTEAQAVAFLRHIHTTCGKGAIEKVEAKVPTDVADYLLNAKREELFQLEKTLKLTISIKGEADYISGQLELETSKRTKKIHDVKTAEPITATDERPELSEEDRKPKEITAAKPKRKRRRKTAAEKKAEMEAATAANEDQPSATEADQTAAAPEDKSAIEASKPEADEQPDTPENKPKRRRRRRKTAAEKKAEMEAAAAETDQTTQSATEPVEAEQPQNATTIEPNTTESETTTEQKPKQRRRRKTVAEKRAEMNAAAEAAQAKESTTEPAETEQPPAETVAESTTAELETAPEQKPKQRRRRKTVAEKRAEMNAAAEAAQAKESATEPAVTEQPPAEAAVESTTTEPETAIEQKPKQRRRRKTVAEKRAEMNAAAEAAQAKKSATEPAETEQPPAETAVDTTAAEQETATEQKPKRRRRKTATEKKAEKDAATTSKSTDTPIAASDKTVDTTVATTETEPVVEKPKPKRRRKTAVEKKAEVEASTEKATGPPDDISKE